jgi:hypothetical protein
VGGAHRYKAAAGGGSSSGSSSGNLKHTQQQQDSPKPPSHLQRKITKSVKFYEKVLSQPAPKGPQVSMVCVCLCGGVRPTKNQPATGGIHMLPSAPRVLTHACPSAAAGHPTMCHALQGVQKKQKKASKTLASLDSLAAELTHITAAAATADGKNSSSDKGGSLSEQQQALLLKGKGTRSSIKRSKARLAVGVSESARLQKVLQHPAYKADPIQVCGGTHISQPALSMYQR